MALRSKAASKTEYNSRPFTKSNLAGRSFCLGVMPIPCPHFKITIVKRSQGQSAVAGAAYQSGERLFSEYDQRTKFYNKKKELVHAEIMLPSYAPPGYADRATLWNAVEAVENQWNSQLARRIVLAFPVEVPKEQYLSMIKEFCQEQFVSKGMIADFAIHDKGDGNPHAHILLTLRAIDEHGKWLPKARKVYDLDENGERIRLASGNWKCHKENTVDWNDQKYAEVWRHGWETITNRYLEAAGRPERVDLRSFERQGIQQIPTVHLGPAAHQMEKRGVETFLGNLNRDIRAANSLMQSIRSAIRGLQRWIADLNEKKQILLDALEQAKEPMLSDLLVDYFNLRNEQRSDWSGKAKLKCTVRDFEEVKRAVDYLKAHSLNTIEDLDTAISNLNQTAAPLRRQLKQNENRMRAIAQIKDAAAAHAKLKPIHDTFIKKNFKLTKDAYFLYEKSGQGVSFTGLVEAMVNEVTIVTAVHNIKSNKGSKTAGVDKIKMDKYLQMPKDELILLIQSCFRNYRPKPARREYIHSDDTEVMIMSRTFTHKTDESTLTTLCPRCLNAFRNTRGIRVRRADPYQLTKEPCTYCQTNFGYDYYIQPTSPKSTYFKKGRFDDESECA